MFRKHGDRQQKVMDSAFVQFGNLFAFMDR